MKESKKILVLTLVAVLAGLSLAAAATLNDAEIQSAIETKFENKKILNGGGPWVAVENGVVTLEGKVKSVWAKNEAIKLAMEVDDVIAVEDFHCVAYGPGILEMAHQPDEYCEVEAVVDATKVLSLVLLESVVGKH